MLVLQATNIGARRPGYEATTALPKNSKKQDPITFQEENTLLVNHNTGCTYSEAHHMK